MPPFLTAFLLIGTGLFMAIIAIMNRDEEMKHPKAQVFVDMFGRTGARVFYLVFGVLVFTYGSWYAVTKFTN
jgi:hypothetical protein